MNRRLGVDGRKIADGEKMLTKESGGKKEGRGVTAAAPRLLLLVLLLLLLRHLGQVVDQDLEGRLHPRPQARFNDISKSGQNTTVSDAIEPQHPQKTQYKIHETQNNQPLQTQNQKHHPQAKSIHIEY